MKSPKTAIAIAALLASLALPSLGDAAPYIPPGNSAATQYTETFPSSGGSVEVNGSIGSRGGSPAKALGHHTAKRLESAGPEGAALAALATETAARAPADEAPSTAVEGEDKRPSKGGTEHGKNGHSGVANGGAGKGGGTGNGGGATPAGGRPETRTGKASLGPSGHAAPGGSSALEQVVSHATLSSAGATGIFLPLVLLGALVWAVAYAVLRRRPGGVHGA